VSLLAFGLVIFAAALHAGWNAVIKASDDAASMTALVVFGAGCVAICVLPFLPPPAPPSWPFLATSMVLQTIYFWLVAATYKAADMSQAYPMMRGLAPLIVAIAGTLVIQEYPTALAWVGVVLISAGVLSLTFRGRTSGRRGVVLALCNALVIASYTITDGTGVRLSGSPAGYSLTLSLLTAIPFTLWFIVRNPGAFVPELRRRWHLGLAGGVATVSSYGLALWAMTEAPVALVSALRETSIAFGTLIAWAILKERIGPLRLLATATIVAGAVALRLA
jgi:drug/metabolite transporter (DMT)-like permease